MLTWAVGLAESSLFLVAVKLSTKKWLKLDATLSALCAATTIPFAMLVQRMETTGIEITPLHGYLTNAYICFLLMPTFAYLFLKDSSDPACTSALLLSRDVGFSLASAVIAYGHFFTNVFNNMHLTYGVLGNVAMACASGYHLHQHGVAKQQGTPSKVDLYLKIDIAMALAVGLLDILIPRTPLAWAGILDPDPLALNLLQAGACMNVGSAVLSYMALRFKDTEDKKSILKSRMAMNVLRFSIRTYYYIRLEPTMTVYTYFLFCLGYLPFFPAYLGIRQKDKM